MPIPLQMVNVHSLRIFDGVCSGAGFAALSGVAVSMVRVRCVGHRMLLWFTVFYFGLRAVSNFVSAWDRYAGTESVDGWVYLVSSLVSLVFACHVMASRDDLLTTLRTSEMEDRLRKDRADDLAQARMNLDYINATTQLKSAELVRRQLSGG